jgi:hypothetical protein
MWLICLVHLQELQTHILIVEEGNVMGRKPVATHMKGQLEGLCSCPSKEGKYVFWVQYLYTGVVKGAVPRQMPVTLQYVDICVFENGNSLLW